MKHFSYSFLILKRLDSQQRGNMCYTQCYSKEIWNFKFLVVLDHFYLKFLLYLPFWLCWYKSACNAIDLGLIPGLGRCPGEGNGYPLQYSGLENSIDCIVHGVTKSQTRLSDFHFYYGWYLPAEYRWPFNLALPYKLNRSVRTRMACFSM